MSGYLDPDSIKRTVSQSILSAVQGLAYNKELTVTGVIAVSLDKGNAVVLNINEHFKHPDELPKDLSAKSGKREVEDVERDNCTWKNGFFPYMDQSTRGFGPHLFPGPSQLPLEPHHVTAMRMYQAREEFNRKYGTHENHRPPSSSLGAPLATGSSLYGVPRSSSLGSPKAGTSSTMVTNLPGHNGGLHPARPRAVDTVRPEAGSNPKPTNSPAETYLKGMTDLSKYGAQEPDVKKEPEAPKMADAPYPLALPNTYLMARFQCQMAMMAAGQMVNPYMFNSMINPLHQSSDVTPNYSGNNNNNLQVVGGTGVMTEVQDADGKDKLRKSLLNSNSRKAKSVRRQSLHDLNEMKKCKIDKRRFQCGVCGVPSSRKFNLQRHLKSHHPGMEGKVVDLQPRRSMDYVHLPHTHNALSYTARSSMDSSYQSYEAREVALDLSGRASVGPSLSSLEAEGHFDGSKERIGSDDIDGSSKDRTSSGSGYESRQEDYPDSEVFENNREEGKPVINYNAKNNGIKLINSELEGGVASMCLEKMDAAELNTQRHVTEDERLVVDFSLDKQLVSTENNEKNGSVERATQQGRDPNGNSFKTKNKNMAERKSRVEKIANNCMVKKSTQF